MTKNELLEKYLAAPSLSARISRETRPIVLYGTGNGADKIIEYLRTLGKSPSAVFASDGFVRCRTFAGLPVESLDDVTKRLGRDIVILMCFGSDRPEVMERARILDAEYDFALPDVPLYGGGMFDDEYVKDNIDALFEVRSMLSDELSKELFDESVLYRLTGRLSHLSVTSLLEDTIKELYAGAGIKRVVDCGAYKGDTAVLFASALPEVEEVIALEPDAGSFKKISELALDGVKLTPCNVAASDRSGEEVFVSSSSRGAGREGRNRRSKEKIVTLARLDEIIDGEVDFIKFDVEGDEASALRGAEGILRKFAPSLALSLYHRTEDLAKLPLLVKSFSDEYKKMKYYLRRPACIPCWDLTLYAVKEK